MRSLDSHTGLTRKVIDALYVEAMVLADEAREYFDRYSHDTRDTLDPVMRVTFSSESLKVTTRLMHIVAWLLTRRSIDDGEIDPMVALSPSQRLGAAVGTNPKMIAAFPESAQQLIGDSCDLYERVKRLDSKLTAPTIADSPARNLQRQIQAML